MLESLTHLLGPLHPPFTHFPIVCSILAVLALFAAKRTPQNKFLEAAAWLWIITFLSALAGTLSGHCFAMHLGLEDHFSLLPSGTLLGGLLREHVLWAALSTVLSILALAASVRTLKGQPWPWGFQLALGLACAIGFGLTGHHGGEMVYGNVGSKEKSPAAAGILGSTQDYREKLVRMNSKTWNSRTHGHRFVNTYVSREAVEAYRNSGDLPEGSLVVKESREAKNGKPSQTPGPLYVMRKGKVGDSPGTGGWQYALVWEKPVPDNPEGIQGPVQWLPGDPHLNSCMKCHNHFKAADFMGGIPDGFQAP